MSLPDLLPDRIRNDNNHGFNPNLTGAKDPNDIHTCTASAYLSTNTQRDPAYHIGGVVDTASAFRRRTRCVPNFTVPCGSRFSTHLAIQHRTSTAPRQRVIFSASRTLSVTPSTCGMLREAGIVWGVIGGSSRTCWTVNCRRRIEVETCRARWPVNNLRSYGVKAISAPMHVLNRCILLQQGSVVCVEVRSALLFGNAACATAGCRRQVVVASYVNNFATGTPTSNRSRYLWLHALPAHGGDHFDSLGVWMTPMVDFFPRSGRSRGMRQSHHTEWSCVDVRAFFASTGTVKVDRRSQAVV